MRTRIALFSTGLLVLAIGLLIAAGGAAARLALRYDRAAIESAELFRLVTGHFAHLGWSHFALNAAGIVLGVAPDGTSSSVA